jgi:hypothetical protein
MSDPSGRPALGVLASALAPAALLTVTIRNVAYVLEATLNSA